MRRGRGETRARLLRSGAELMAARGFAGVSVRAICEHADTSINMVHHYFGSKQGLLDAIVSTYGDRVLEVPLRLLAAPARSQDDFVSRMELHFAAALDAFAENRSLLMVVIREQADPAALAAYGRQLTRFLEDAKAAGIVRSDLDTEMITGALLDRLINQVQFAPWLKRVHGIDLEDPAYRERWCGANIDLFLRGMVA